MVVRVLCLVGREQVVVGHLLEHAGDILRALGGRSSPVLRGHVHPRPDVPRFHLPRTDGVVPVGSGHLSLYPHPLAEYFQDLLLLGVDLLDEFDPQPVSQRLRIPEVVDHLSRPYGVRVLDIVAEAFVVLIGHLVVGDVRPLAPSRDGVQLVEESGLLLAGVVGLLIQAFHLLLQGGNLAGASQRCPIGETLLVLDDVLQFVRQCACDAPGTRPAVEVEQHGVGARVEESRAPFLGVVDSQSEIPDVGVRLQHGGVGREDVSQAVLLSEL